MVVIIAPVNRNLTLLRFYFLNLDQIRLSVGNHCLHLCLYFRTSINLKYLIKFYPLHLPKTRSSRIIVERECRLRIECYIFKFVQVSQNILVHFLFERILLVGNEKTRDEQLVGRKVLQHNSVIPH